MGSKFTHADEFTQTGGLGNRMLNINGLSLTASQTCSCGLVRRPSLVQARRVQNDKLTAT